MLDSASVFTLVKYSETSEAVRPRARGPRGVTGFAPAPRLGNSSGRCVKSTASAGSVVLASSVSADTFAAAAAALLASHEVVPAAVPEVVAEWNMVGGPVIAKLLAAARQGAVVIGDCITR